MTTLNLPTALRAAQAAQLAAARVRDSGIAKVRVLVVAAHPDYEALALDELGRGGFHYESRLVTGIEQLHELLSAPGVADTWDIALVIDTPDGPSAGDALQAFARRLPETPAIFIGRGAPVGLPAGLESVRAVDLRSLSGAAADALREIERHRERRRGAQALRASEIRFATAFESAPIGLAVVRVDGRFLDVNPLFCSIAGIDRDAVVAATPAQVAADELLSCVRDAALRVVPGGSCEPLERRCLRVDGTQVWMRVSASAALDDAGEPLYLVAHVEDVTARREAEEAQARSDALFTAIFNSTNVGMCIVDMDGAFVKTNRAYQEILGYTGDELGGLRFQDVTHPDDIEPNVSLHTQRLREDSSYRMEKRCLRKDGTEVWTELSGAPLHDVPGPELSVGAIVDITERKRAAAALAESARTLETARSIAGLGSWVGTRASTDADPVLTWSPEMFQALGLDPEGPAPTIATLYESVHPDDRESLRAHAAAALTGAGRFDLEFRVVRPDGEVRWVREQADLFPGERGSLRLVGVLLDVTELRGGRELLAGGGAEPATCPSGH